MRLMISLFSPATGTLGGLTRGLAVAGAATDAGHAVAFCAGGVLAGELRERGWRVYETPAPTMLGLPKAISRRLEARVSRSSLPVPAGRSVGSIWTVLVVSGYARRAYLQRVVHAEGEAARDFGASALFTDVDPAAYLLATTSGLPIATAYQSVLGRGVGSLPWRVVGRATTAILRANRGTVCPPETLFWGPRVLKLVPSISTLDGGGPERDDLHYVGHLSGQLEAPTTTGFEPERDKRYVFAYLGTGSVSLRAAERVLPAVFPADSERRCIVASSAVESPYRLGGVEFRRFVPAAEVLPVADWVLCHGGLNTVIESLRAGVPLLLFPGAIFERRFNAAAVAGAGAGVIGETNAFTPAKLQAAMDRHEELAAGARRLGAEIEARGGAVEAVRLMAAQFEPVPVAAG